MPQVCSPWKPEEGIDPQELISGSQTLPWMLGSELGSSGGATLVLSC